MRSIPHFPVSDPRLAQLMIAVKAADAAISSTLPPQGLPDEQQWIDQLRRGERAALERLVHEHQDRLRRLVSRMSGWAGKQETDDLVQEVFVNALGSIGRFRGGSRLSTWLTKIAVNVCRSHYRTRVFRAELWKRWMLSQKTESASEFDASHDADRRERIEHMTRAVRKLNAKYREVIVMHYLEEMSAEEIQHVLGISRNMVEVRLHRARKMLQEMLELTAKSKQP